MSPSKISTPILAFTFILVGFNLEASIKNSNKLTAIAQSAPQLNQPQQALFPIVVNDKAGKQKWGFIDRAGKVVIQPQFDMIQGFNGDLAPVQINKKWGYIDRTGKIIVQPQFVGSKWGYIDLSGKFVIKPQFDRAYTFSEDIAMVTINNKTSYTGTNW
jgi:hypothetical protein